MRKKIFDIAAAFTVITLLFAACSHGDNDYYEERFVAYRPTGLPVVRVDTENNAAIADKENWVSATISVSGAADES